MLATLQRYGDDTSHWVPPQTNHDRYLPPAAAKTNVDAFGVPKVLPMNVDMLISGSLFIIIFGIGHHLRLALR